MKFEELEGRFRELESLHVEKLSFEGWTIARLDGRGFTRLTKHSLELEKPFDVRFHEAMKATVAHLCDCGFAVRLAYSQSDEISLLFELTERSFDGKKRKWLSVLAGEASAAFSLQLGQIGAFDCRLIELPDAEIVSDYFRWRQSDAWRNALNAHCYWILRAQNLSPNTATKQLSGLSIERKEALLGENGIDLQALPLWQRRGFAVMWQEFEKVGFNPNTQSETRAVRKRLHFETELPDGDEFGLWLGGNLGA
ncbi:guanylyltransferase [bacterium]|nr:MAG: guanylyltransferase [bacterium]